jgi:hypothetical protein
VILSLNGHPAADGSLSIPRVGRPTAEFRLAVSGEEAPIQVGQPVSLRFESGETYQMTAFRAQADGAFWRVGLVGGANRIRTRLNAKFYVGVPAYVILRDILSEVGETPGEINAPDLLPAWPRFARAAGQELQTLLARFNLSWRIEPDGRVWIGREAPQPYPETLEALEAAPQWGRYVFALTPALRPGMSLKADVGGFAVSIGMVGDLVHHIGSQLRTEVYVV